MPQKPTTSRGRALRTLLVLLAATFLARSVRIDPAARAEGPGSSRADFSGTWALNAALSEDPLEKWESAWGTKVTTGDFGDFGGSRGGRGGSPASFGLPSIVLENDRRLTLVDQGTRFLIRRDRDPSHERILYTDGRETIVDGSDGPVTVTAKRSGTRGEKLAVTMKWPDGRDLKETWELLDSPRRVAVAAKVGGRRPISYRRVYEPAAPLPDPTPTPIPSPSAGETPGAAGGPGAAGRAGAGGAGSPAAAGEPFTAVAPAGMSKCSVKPPRGARPSELPPLAKIGADDAAARARAALSGARIRSVVSSDVEVIEGCLAWSFFVRFDDRKGVQEVVIDAGDGKVLASTYEE